MKLIYNVEDKPQISERIVFAFQQLLAIMAATIAVPAIVGNGMTASAALFGAGVEWHLPGRYWLPDPSGRGPEGGGDPPDHGHPHPSARHRNGVRSDRKSVV